MQILGNVGTVCSGTVVPLPEVFTGVCEPCGETELSSGFQFNCKDPVLLETGKSKMTHSMIRCRFMDAQELLPSISTWGNIQPSTWPEQG